MSKEKTIVEKIKKVILGEEEITLAEMTLEDGTVIFAEAFESGEAVWMLDGEERVPLTVGEYTLADGAILSVTAEGVIDTIAAKTEEELTNEDLEAIEKMKAENEELKTQNEKLKAGEEKAKTQLSKRSSKGVRVSPEGKVDLSKPELTKMDLVNMSTKQRISYRMQQTPFYNNVKLATTESITTTYAGEFAGQYIAAATLSGNTLGSNAITVKPNIKLKQVVKKLATASILGDATCDFSPTGTVTLTEAILTPKELQVNLELCKTDFKSDWDAISMGYSAFDVLPPNFQAFFVENVAGIVNAAVESSVWHGVEATAGQFEGLVVKMTADGTVVDEAGTTVTADNVITELGTIVAKIPANVYNEPDMTLYVSPTVGKAYISALGGFGTAATSNSGVNAQGTQWYNRGAGLTFDGIPIFIANGLTTSYCVAAQASNLWYGTGLMNDLNEVQIIDMAPIDGSKNIRFVMRFTAGTQIGIGAEIVLYTPA
jgi:hypothetical protein